MNWLKRRINHWLMSDAPDMAVRGYDSPQVNMIGGLEHKGAMKRIFNVTITKADNGYVVQSGQAVFITDDITKAVDQIIAGVVAESMSRT